MNRHAATSSLRAFIVEDTEAIRFLLGRMLEMKGFVVTEAFDGESARTAAASVEHAPDLVVMDFNLPNTDTFGLIDELQAKWPSCQVLLASGLPLTLLPPRASQMEFMPKPFTMAALTKKLDVLLGSSARRRAA